MCRWERKHPLAAARGREAYGRVLDISKGRGEGEMGRFFCNIQNEKLINVTNAPWLAHSPHVREKGNI